MITRLPLEYYQELLHLSPLPFDVGSLELFNLVVQLKLLRGLFRGSDPVIGDAKSIMRLAQLGLGRNRLRVIANRFFHVVFRGSEDAQLQVRVRASRAIRIYGHNFLEQCLCLRTGLQVRGLFFTLQNRHGVEIVGERILGLGDQGAGGMGIPIGKLALYTALAGIHPLTCLPVLLDVGTDNMERTTNPLYIGWRHERVRGAEYDKFVDGFVRVVRKRWPHVLLQWEDFAGHNAARLLERYRDVLPSFNDDIQGTAAVAVATLLAAVKVTGIPLPQQRFVVFGFGSAGLGITELIRKALVSEGLSDAAARERFYAVDQYGLIVEGMDGLGKEQAAFARTRKEVEG